MFDPEEYVDWQPDSAVMDEYHRTLAADSERQAIIREMSEVTLLDLYSGMLRFRLHDITLRRWVKQGVLSKAWLGTGEEAVTIGNVHALDRSCDLVAPMIRNAAPATKWECLSPTCCGNTWRPRIPPAGERTFTSEG